MFGKKKEIEAPIRPAVQETVKEEVIEAVKEAEEAPVQTVQAPPFKTIIASGTELVGNFETSESILLLGDLQGNIHSTDSLSIASCGSLKGEAAVKKLSSDGYIEGAVLCKELSEFGSLAKMKGNLSTSALTTADGSSFEGKLTMIAKGAEEAAEETAQEPESIEDAAEDATNIFEAARIEAEASAEDAEEDIQESAGEFEDLFNTAAKRAGEATDLADRLKELEKRYEQ